MAVISATPAEGVEPLDVQLDGTGSHSLNGGIAGYHWDLGDGGPGVEGAAATHTYAKPGIYLVKLTVTDALGFESETSRAVTVRFRSEDIFSLDQHRRGRSRAGDGRRGPARRGLSPDVLGGKDIGLPASDGFHFIHRTLSGDAVITARVSPSDWPTNAASGS